MTDSVYTSTGMAGFSEHGPGDWDFGVGSVTGYRWWYWHVPPKLAGYRDEKWRNGGDTYSYLIGAYKGEWEPGRIEAKCRANGFNSYSYGMPTGEHTVPANQCGCGFWAYWEQGLKAEDVLYNRNVEPKISTEYYLNKVPTVKIPVLGVVEGSGRTVIGTKGFRSQYAKVKALCLPDEARKLLSYWVVTDAAVAGRQGYYDMEPSNYPSWAYIFEKASDLEVVNRMTTAEEALNELYPDIKVCPDRESMMKQFPKDTFGAPTEE